MDLMVEHLLVEVHRCLSSFFPTRFSGWPTSCTAGMMPPYEAPGELPRTPLSGSSQNTPSTQSGEYGPLVFLVTRVLSKSPTPSIWIVSPQHAGAHLPAQGCEMLENSVMPLRSTVE